MVNLRPLISTDKFELTKLANNKNVWDNLRDYFPFPYGIKDAEAFIQLTLKEDPQQNFGITYNDQLCGVVGVLVQKDVYRRSGEIGYWLGEPYWGKGIATEAVRLVTDYGFNQLKLVRLFAGVFEFNHQSMKVLEKNGFQKEGVFKKAVFKNNKIYDEHRYFKLAPS